MRYRRALHLASDAAAMRAAWDAAINEGSVSERLDQWRIPVLFCLAAGDVDFLDQARNAAEEIPDAELVIVGETDHLGMDTANLDPLVPTVLQALSTGRLVDRSRISSSSDRRAEEPSHGRRPDGHAGGVMNLAIQTRRGVSRNTWPLNQAPA